MVARSLLWLVLLALAMPAQSVEWRGYIATEGRYFFSSPLDARQHSGNLAYVVAPEMYVEWDDRRQSFLFTPFARLDQNDEARTHADIRELTWLYAADAWELRVGIRQLFWGVTESQHLVDIINQTDLVEDPDGEAKLGQPMVNLALIREWGTLDLFVLPYARERTYPGVEGRLRTEPYIDTDQARYESGQKERHVDYALRWAHSIDLLDIGLSHFYGTSRDPLFELGQRDGEPVLLPLYEIIHQSGVDLQLTLDAWLWKLEAIHRSSASQRYSAVTAGFEYTLYGIFDSVFDVGLLYEYLYDSRGDEALTPFADDSMIATRLAFNDEASTELLVGLFLDNGGAGSALNIEGSRRLGDRWKLNIRGRAYFDIDPQEIIYGFRKDDYLQAEVQYFF